MNLGCFFKEKKDSALFVSSLLRRKEEENAESAEMGEGANPTNTDIAILDMQTDRDNQESNFGEEEDAEGISRE